MTALEDLIALASQDGRVCPQPMVWSRLWEELPHRQRVATGWDPPAPLILAAWWETSDAAKRERFRIHLRWADEHGALCAVADLLSNMKPEDWHLEQ